MFGGMPGVIVDYNPTKRTASVQPSILRARLGEDDQRIATPLPILLDVPVIMFGTAKVRVKLTLTKGDPVLLLFMGVSLDRWKKLGTGVDPGDDRRHDYNDAIAIPGCIDPAHASEDAVVLEFTSTEIRAGGTEPLVTRAEFLGHGHPVIATGAVTPTTGPVSTLTGGSALTFPGTPHLRG